VQGIILDLDSNPACRAHSNRVAAIALD
jgi:hypothetical protein